MTYPSPTTMYSPKYHTLSTIFPLSPTTHMALAATNHRLATSTAYNDHFPSPTPCSLPARPFHSPDAARGKYASLPHFSGSTLSNDRNVPLGNMGLGIGGLGSKPQDDEPQNMNEPPSTDETQSPPDKGKVGFHIPSLSSDKPDTEDKMTQTDLEESNLLENATELVSMGQWMDSNKVPKYATGRQASVRQSSAVTQYTTDSDYASTCGTHPNSAAAGPSNGLPPPNHDLNVPFSRSKALREFRMLYLERPPDLRENATHTGRRHVINGYHAYYWQ